jgi:polysaccharide biosynthesis/export protein ExoF
MMRRIAMISALLALSPVFGPAAADTYSIGPGDKLELRVLEWQPLENRVLEWESMRAELAVDSDGMVSVPFIGQVEAQLLSPADLSRMISERLQQRFAVPAALDASVQVVTYRPVYVTGAVRSPGEYPFRPGLTAAQLIAQAARTNAEVDMRDILNREGSMELLSLESKRLAIRRAMLLAAIEDRDSIALPQGLNAAAWAPEIVAGENEVLRLRQQRRARELEALDNQIELLQSELDALIESAAAQERLLESAQREYDNVQSLAEGGLAIGARVAESERNLILAGSQILNMSTAILQARQEISLAEAEKVALRDREWLEDTRELQKVEGELERVLTTLKTQQRIAVAETGMVLVEREAEEAQGLTVTVVRQTREGMQELSGEDTVLAPGDVVHVEAPALRATQLLDGARAPSQ